MTIWMLADTEEEGEEKEEEVLLLDQHNWLHTASRVRHIDQSILAKVEEYE